MKFATSKELRLRARELLEMVRSGQRVVITYRGKPVAWLLPFEEERPEPSIRPYEEAWSEIEQALEATEPAYPDWEPALEESRRRR